MLYIRTCSCFDDYFVEKQQGSENVQKPCSIFREKYDQLQEQLHIISCMDDLLSGKLLDTSMIETSKFIGLHPQISKSLKIHRTQTTYIVAYTTFITRTQE